MNTVEQLTAGIEFAPDFDASRLSFNQDVGFLAIEGVGIQLVAFHATEEQGSTLTPITRLENRLPEHQGLNNNAKGVGVILGNTRTSVTNTANRTLGVWATPELQREDILDLSSPNPHNPAVMAQGILRHAGLILRAKRTGVQAAIEAVEQPYGDHGLVVINPAPKVLLQQQKQGLSHVISPRWAVYRDWQRRPLQRVGVVVQ